MKQTLQENTSRGTMKGQTSVTSGDYMYSSASSYTSRWYRFLSLLVISTVLTTLWLLPFLNYDGKLENTVSPFDHLSAHCSRIPPIQPSEFFSRQRALAKVLLELGGAAYVAEPGANAQFFGNISSSKWHLSERPLLLVVTAETEGVEVAPKLSVLTPTFEATRAKLLPVPAELNITYVDWPEDANPYEITANNIIGKQKGKIFVDSSIRKFIADGLAKALPDKKVESAPLEITTLRERKSPSELDILRCANEVTLLAIRAVRDQTKIGMYESEVQDLISAALTSAGLKGGYGLVLFGENAALPHGSGTNRRLGASDYVLIDCGGTLYDYNSDITRTFAVKEQDPSTIPVKHLQIWRDVHQAQREAMSVAVNGSQTQVVDKAARSYLTSVGYGSYFTHRLGHGLGLETHGSPYLRGGSEDIIRSGHVFSNEPGVYIEEQVGVRLEDAIYINEEGFAEYLTDGVGGQATSPWAP